MENDLEAFIDPNQNSFTFNSEFFTTNELIVRGTRIIQFTIIDEASNFNANTGEFEDIPNNSFGAALVRNVKTIQNTSL